MVNNLYNGIPEQEDVWYPYGSKKVGSSYEYGQYNIMADGTIYDKTNRTNITTEQMKRALQLKGDTDAFKEKDVNILQYDRNNQGYMKAVDPNSIPNFMKNNNVQMAMNGDSNSTDPNLEQPLPTEEEVITTTASSSPEEIAAAKEAALIAKRNGTNEVSIVPTNNNVLVDNPTIALNESIKEDIPSGYKSDKQINEENDAAAAKIKAKGIDDESDTIDKLRKNSILSGMIEAGGMTSNIVDLIENENSSYKPLENQFGLNLSRIKAPSILPGAKESIDRIARTSINLSRESGNENAPIGIGSNANDAVLKAMSTQANADASAINQTAKLNSQERARYEASQNRTAEINKQGSDYFDKTKLALSGSGKQQIYNFGKNMAAIAGNFDIQKEGIKLKEDQAFNSQFMTLLETMIGQGYNPSTNSSI